MNTASIGIHVKNISNGKILVCKEEVPVFNEIVVKLKKILVSIVLFAKNKK